jgi:hypothetical protein
MSKLQKETIRTAESEGLKFCGIESRSKHEFLVFENKDGLQYWLPQHRSTEEARSLHKITNKLNLRRFANGNLVGLERMIRGGKHANA